MRYWDTNTLTERLYPSGAPDPLPAGVVVLPAEHDAWKKPTPGLHTEYTDGIPAHVVDPATTFEQLREAKCEELCSNYETAMNHPAVLGVYTQREIDTFPEQAREAVEYVSIVDAGGTPTPAAYPMSLAIADQHPERSLDDQMNRIINKRGAFNTFCGAVTGKHQVMRSAVDACTNQAELDAIDTAEIITFAEGLLGG